MKGYIFIKRKTNCHIFIKRKINCQGLLTHDEILLSGTAHNDILLVRDCTMLVGEPAYPGQNDR